MLRLLSDEDFNGNVIDGVRRHYPEVDLIRVQDVGLSGHEDPDVLAWAAENGRNLLTNDRQTMINFALMRIASGLNTPGVFVLRRRTSIHDAIEAVALVALEGEAADWVAGVHWIPFT